MPQDSIFLRIGDGGDYENFGDDLDAVVDALVEAGVRPFKTGGVQWIKNGFESPGHQGWNYISLYRGNAEANFESSLTKADRDYIVKSLSEAVRTSTGA
jgi:hypothetical protein